MYLCICFAVRDREVDEAVDAGAVTADEVADRTGASTGCGSCRETICARVAARRQLKVDLPAAV